MDFPTLFKKKPFVLLDGAMGTMLQKAGLPLGAVPELLNLTNPEQILAVHRAYIQAGADVIYANTFGANRHKLAGSGHAAAEVVAAGVSIARRAAEGTGCLVALDIGPIGQLLAPAGSLSFEEAVGIFREQVEAGAKAGADLIVLETLTDLGEARAAVLAAKENSTLPILCTMTFEQNRRTFTGCGVPSMALTLEGLGVDALGINCSLGPDELPPLVDELLEWTHLPLVVKPNAGLPDPATGEYSVSPAQFAASAAALAKKGVQILGGCCGTTPETIAALKRALAELPAPPPRAHQPNAAVCSATRVVPIDRARIIGERINPTGKKLFKAALLREDVDYILNQALQQTEAGADILDVNVGLPEIDEPAMMARCVHALQSVTDAPLQLDSSDPRALEAGLRLYHGRAIVNSVNGDGESLDAVLPLVKKYGAAVVGLTLDKNGIPATAEERLTIARRILDRALSLGIPRQNVFIDCLTLTASAEQAAARETLRALRMVKEELGLKTVLGVSNISFGLPNRELVNQTFLTLALAHGLDLPIINPNVPAMTGAVQAYHLLYNLDPGAQKYIAAYAGMKTAAPPAPAAPAASEAAAKPPQEGLAYAVENGLKAEAARLTASLLETTDAMEIVDTLLIPALDRTGTAFEKGTLFLPQLIQAAGAAQAAFDVIKAKLSSGDQPAVSKGVIVLATVKGDIHDIGKNIVKVLLENYGYTVIDLGRDVEYQAVVDAALRHKADIVGLSALMTTTLKSMEKTIALLHENRVPARILVGGAVLTPEYAKKIGADYYAKDAKESVDIARQIIGK
ncbi:MAG TPA: homocysteine S-methyltransferase family protein [Firmicutes bacterium]|nr:homocysteine S-methyltransferase family protein [Bacillota bacterium]